MVFMILFSVLVLVYFSRYEVPELQQRVMKAFDQLKDDSYWTEIDADKEFNDLHQELLSHCDQAINDISNDKLDKLW